MEPSTQWIASKYTLVREDFEKIFLYLTTIPAVILTAAEKNIAESKEAINLFHNFRNTSRVPLQSLVLEKIWKAASEISGIGELNYFTYFTADELSSLFNGGKIPSKEEIEKRKTFCTFYDDKGNIIFNYDCSFLDKIGIKKEEMPLDDKITGNISFKGLVVGTVKIVNKPVDMAKFNDGDIVVSINTSPNIMPVLRKCKAIITDEGGLMCHASIISRELKIPTIVGTKIATKWLKDGDLVEVDADNGIVRKMR
jgi:phosphohistidine swiveling domain-containing protein